MCIRDRDGDIAGQLQVIQLLFKAVALVGQVAGGLGIFRQAGCFGLGFSGGQVILCLLYTSRCV